MQSSRPPFRFPPRIKPSQSSSSAGHSLDGARAFQFMTHVTEEDSSPEKSAGSFPRCSTFVKTIYCINLVVVQHGLTKSIAISIQTHQTPGNFIVFISLAYYRYSAPSSRTRSSSSSGARPQSCCSDLKRFIFLFKCSQLAKIKCGTHGSTFTTSSSSSFI